MLIVQQGECKLYELFAATRLAGGAWKAGSGAIFDLRNNALRPEGWTSADAAGLPIAPGLVRYEEVASGEIRHALRLTVPRTRREFVWPARHFASSSNDQNLPAMGQRFRLRADYRIDGFHPQVQVILKALKKYGLILSDNGSSWFITGAPDSRWDDGILADLKKVPGSALEAVDTSQLMVSPNSAMAGAPITSNRTAVPFSATPVFDVSGVTALSITLKASVVSSSLVNLTDGQTVSFLICQDEVGGHQFTWPPEVRGGVSIGTSPGTCTAQQFVSDGTKLYATSAGVTDMI